MVPARNLEKYNVKLQGIISCAIKHNCFAALPGEKLLGDVVHDGTIDPMNPPFLKKWVPYSETMLHGILC